MKVGLVDKAEEYLWSSAKGHLTDKNDPLLCYPDWLDLAEREAYSDFVKKSDTDIDGLIRKATSTGRPFGTEVFIDKMEFSLGLSLRPRKPGRPRKKM